MRWSVRNPKEKGTRVSQEREGEKAEILYCEPPCSQPCRSIPKPSKSSSSVNQGKMASVPSPPEFVGKCKTVILEFGS